MSDDKGRRTERAADLLRIILDRPDLGTGGEAGTAHTIAEWLYGNGVTSAVTELSPGQANLVIGAESWTPGSGLLLYAPIDAMLDAADRAAGWFGDQPTTAAPGYRRSAETIIGHGAGNPLGHAVGCVEAYLRLVESGRVTSGAVAVGLGCAGMPLGTRLPWESSAPNATRLGHGAGCYAIVTSLRPAAAVIAKPGWTISQEEVGLNWFTIDIAGSATYVGVRHRGTYSNPILHLGRVLAAFEEWAAAYTRAHTTNAMSPQAAVGAVQAGWPEQISFGAPTVRLFVDVRSVPDTDLDALARSLDQWAVAHTKANPDYSVRVNQVLSIPGTRTESVEPIVTSAARAWRRVVGSDYVPRTGASGATDANVLRACGVPTVRIGMAPPAANPNDDPFLAAMNTVDLDALDQLADIIAAVAEDFVTTTGPPIDAGS